MTDVEQWPYRAVAQALEVIPRTLIQNCGASTIRILTALRVITEINLNVCVTKSCCQAKHTQTGNETWGVDGESGQIVDMKDFAVWEPLAVKMQVYKTAMEVSLLLIVTQCFDEE